MYFDPAEAAREKKMIENYESLKEFLKGKEEFVLARKNLISMELKIQRLEVELDKYHKFFNQFSELLPKHYF